MIEKALLKPLFFIHISFGVTLKRNRDGQIPRHPF